MKASRKIITTILVTTAFAFTLFSINAQNKTYTIDDRGPAGGWIFYDKGRMSDGWRYLEAAPEDQSEGIQWFNGEIKATGATGTEIGSGRLNTQKIIKAQGNGKYAAKICADYRGGGKSDWFLPSKDEANLMRKNLNKNRAAGFREEFYWTSSERDAYVAWLQSFGYGDQNFTSKTSFTIPVRAIRAF